MVYSISNNVPPRSELNYTQIPIGVEERIRPIRQQSGSARRYNLGTLVFTTVENMPGSVHVGNQVYYIGQALDFNQTQPQAASVVNGDLETQHDQFYVDIANTGLDQSDVDTMEAEAQATQTILIAELEALQKRNDDLQIEAVNQRRIINETTRIIGALDVMLAAGQNVQGIKDKTLASQAAAQAALTAAITELDVMPALMASQHDKIRAVSILIG